MIARRERANQRERFAPRFVRCLAPHKLMVRVIPYGDYIARMAEGLLAGPSRGRTCTPASYAGRARRRACERRAAAAGWQVPAEPTMPQLNSQVL